MKRINKTSLWLIIISFFIFFNVLNGVMDTVKKAAGDKLSSLNPFSDGEKKNTEKIIDGPDYAGFSMEPTIDEFNKQELDFYVDEVNEMSGGLHSKLENFGVDVGKKLDKIKRIAEELEPKEKELHKIERELISNSKKTQDDQRRIRL